MSSERRERHPHRILPTDLWSECLSYLSPEELGLVLVSFEHVFDMTAAVEQASWLSVASMVTAAEDFRREIRTRRAATGNDDDDEPHNYDGPRRALRAIVIEAEDDEEGGGRALGAFLRRQGVIGLSSSSPTTGAARRRRPVRFEGEFWFHLYFLVDRILFMATPPTSGGDGDDDDARWLRSALVAELVLVRDEGRGVSSLSSYLGKRADLHAIAAACATVCPSIEGMVSEARLHLIALKLGREGFWSFASSVVNRSSPFLGKDEGNDQKDRDHVDGGGDRSNSTANGDDGNDDDADLHGASPPPPSTPLTPSLLSIDGMICASTFLVDLAYSVTPLHHAGVREIALAVTLGRKAVVLAEERRRRSTSTMAVTTATTIEMQKLTTTNTTSPSAAPPAAVESLFGSDALRCIHAKLALGRALSLLAQLTGTRYSKPRTLEAHGVHPLPLSSLEEDWDPAPMRCWVDDEDLLGGDIFIEPHYRLHVDWSGRFFRESLRHLRGSLALCEEEEERRRRPGGIRWDFFGDKASAALAFAYGALQSALADRECLIAHVAGYWRNDQSLDQHIHASISAFCSAFRFLMEGMMTPPPQSSSRMTVAADDDDDRLPFGAAVATGLDVLMECAKGFGRVCASARQAKVSLGLGFEDIIGRKIRLFSRGQLMTDDDYLNTNPDLLFLRFAHLVSICARGTSHPATQSIYYLSQKDPRGVWTAVWDFSPENFRADPRNATLALARHYRTVADWLASEYGGDSGGLSL